MKIRTYKSKFETKGFFFGLRDLRNGPHPLPIPSHNYWGLQFPGARRVEELPQSRISYAYVHLATLEGLFCFGMDRIVSVLPC